MARRAVRPLPSRSRPVAPPVAPRLLPRLPPSGSGRPAPAARSRPTSGAAETRCRAPHTARPRARTPRRRRVRTAHPAGTRTRHRRDRLPPATHRGPVRVPAAVRVGGPQRQRCPAPWSPAHSSLRGPSRSPLPAAGTGGERSRARATAARSRPFPLDAPRELPLRHAPLQLFPLVVLLLRLGECDRHLGEPVLEVQLERHDGESLATREIGRASCRERV